MTDLTRERVQSLLTTRRLGRSLTLQASTGSTNDDARRAASEGCADGHLIQADTQTQGRGSRGRTWLSPPGSDLYFSIVARLALPPPSLPPLTLVVGLAAAETIDALLREAGTPRGHTAQVKWPNDVWLGGHKLVGILVESASLGDQFEPVVIGVGINVNRLEFPSDLEVPASSLALAAGCDLARARVLADFCNRLEPRLDEFVRHGPGAAIDALNERLALRSQRATCGELTGVVERVATSGALLMHTAEGPRECLSGTLRGCGPTHEAPA
jgi:BirA family transcriptional regulator, biotin operon repressor / biotin---[acetyl-CoA-carboxylase] ligase